MPDAVVLGLAIPITGLLLLAAMMDIAFRQIVNWIPIALAIAGLVLRVWYGQFMVGAATGAVVFLVCMLLWRFGFMGGGDVKLFAAAATTVAPAVALSFVLTVVLAGGVLALLYLVLRRVVARPGPVRPSSLLARIGRAERRRIHQCRSLPYACAIATGAILTIAAG